MMNKIIFLGIGLVAGAGIGILVTKKYYRDLAFHEISEVRTAYKKMAASKEAANKNEEQKKQFLEDISGKSGTSGAEKLENTEEIVAENLQKAAEEAVKRYSGQRIEELEPPVHHNVFSNPPEEDIWSDEDEDPYEFVVDHEHPRDGYSEPYEITEEEFASEKMFYDKVMIEYYSDDICVEEASDHIIESIEDLIGPDILDHYDTTEKGEAYVRNDNRSSDYGIIFMGAKFVPKEGYS